MPRATYADLVSEVRAQVDVDPAVALSWLMDRSRVLNAESAWNLAYADLMAHEGHREYALPDDCLWIEALFLSNVPYQRATSHQMDARLRGMGDTFEGEFFPSRNAGVSGSSYGIYADGASYGPRRYIIIDPGPSAADSAVEIRYVADLPDDLTSPLFPRDFDQTLVDGAISIGLARMDERFDSAGYFDARFNAAVGRLRRRRHGRVGRGAIALRVVS